MGPPPPVGDIEEEAIDKGSVPRGDRRRPPAPESGSSADPLDWPLVALEGDPMGEVEGVLGASPGDVGRVGRDGENRVVGTRMRSCQGGKVVGTEGEPWTPLREAGERVLSEGSGRLDVLPPPLLRKTCLGRKEGRSRRLGLEREKEGGEK